MKNCKPIFANATTNTPAENESILETASSSKSTEAYNQSNSSTTDNTANPQPTTQDNSTTDGPNTVQSTTTGTTGTTAYITKSILENKTKVDNVIPIVTKNQSTLLKTNSPSTNSQQIQCSDTTVQSTASEGSFNEPNKTIDLSSLSAELEDGKLIEEKRTTVDDKSNSDSKSQNTSDIFYNTIIN